MERAVMPRTTRISIETETLLVIRRANAASARCPGCHADVDVIGLDSDCFAEPAIAARIQEWLANGKVHSWQTTNGPTQICLTSLFRCFELEVPERLCRSTGIPLCQSRRKQS